MCTLLRSAIRWQDSLAELLLLLLRVIRVSSLCLPPNLPPTPHLQNASDPRAIEELMGSMDENNDGELTFAEFWQLIGKLAGRQGGFSP